MTTLIMIVCGNCDGFMYSVFIPGALKVSRVSGHGEVFSGWLIGTYLLGTFVTTFLLWAATRSNVEAKVRSWGRAIVMFSVGNLIVSSILQVLTVKHLLTWSSVGSILLVLSF